MVARTVRMNGKIELMEVSKVRTGRPRSLNEAGELSLFCYRKAGNPIGVCASTFRVSIPTANRIIAKHGGARIPTPRLPKHGHTIAGKVSPAYRTWKGMWQRCSNPKSSSFKSYGGRGISVCTRWEIFENFFEDMGHPPVGRSLDRINNDGNYEPGNCRWATQKEQVNNQRPRKKGYTRDPYRKTI